MLKKTLFAMAKIINIKDHKKPPTDKNNEVRQKSTIIRMMESTDPLEKEKFAFFLKTVKEIDDQFSSRKKD